MGHNIVFLVDSSSSMKEKVKDETHLQKTIQAIKEVLTNPDTARSEDFLSVIFFWIDVLNRFKTETIYDNVQLSTGASSEKLVEFEPPDHAGTGLEQGLDFAVKFLAKKKGEKTIKLVTDNSINAQKAREKNIYEFYEKGIRLDCIIIGEKRKKSATLGAGSLGQVFEVSDVDAILNALLS